MPIDIPGGAVPSSDVAGDVSHTGVSALDFSCVSRVSERTAWVRPRGELDLATTPAFQEALEACRRVRLIVLDLRGLSFIDSAGGHVIEQISARARASGRRLVIVRGPTRVHRVLMLGGFLHGLPIVNLESALHRERTECG